MLLRGIADDDYLSTLQPYVRDVDETEVLDFIDSLIARRRAQLADLREQPTSRLTEAFAELGTIGVIAREDYACCTTCGNSAIRGEINEHPGAHGYVYYHEQDTEDLLDSRSTYIGSGIFRDAHISHDEWRRLSREEQAETYERLMVAFMRDEVFPVLRRHDIDVEWNEDLGERILLSNVDYFASI